MPPSKRKSAAVPIIDEILDSPAPKKRQSSGTARKRARDEKESSNEVLIKDITLSSSKIKKESKKKKTELVDSSVEETTKTPSKQPVEKTPRKITNKRDSVNESKLVVNSSINNVTNDIEPTEIKTTRRQSLRPLLK